MLIRSGLTTAITLFSLLTTTTTQAQLPNCAGIGNAKLEFRFANNTPLGAGTTGSVFLIGEPDTCLWFVCDLERGPGAISHPLFGTAELCIPLGPSYVNLLDTCLGSSGVLELPVKIPLGFTECVELSCQWAGINPHTFEITVSNMVSTNTNVKRCNEVNRLSYSTSFATPTAFPVEITSGYNSSQRDRVKISYDPANPPVYPIRAGKTSIDKITVLGHDLCVFSSVDPGSRGNKLLALGNTSKLRVSVGNETNATTLDTSCATPLAAGLVFGDFLITDVFDPMGCAMAHDRMTGGGSIFTGGTRFTHGFELYCGPSRLPNNLEINWGGNRFHLTTLTSSVCTDDPNIDPGNPAAPFDTMVGHGVGRLNGVPGASIKFRLTDAGESGRNDEFEFTIDDGTNPPISASGKLTRGNQQAHPGNNR